MKGGTLSDIKNDFNDKQVRMVTSNIGYAKSKSSNPNKRDRSSGYYKKNDLVNSQEYDEKVGLNFFLYKGGLKDIDASANLEAYFEAKSNSLSIWLRKRELIMSRQAGTISVIRVNIPWENIVHVTNETDMGFFSHSDNLIIEYKDNKNIHHKAKFYNGPEAEKVRPGEFLPRYNAALTFEVLRKIMPKIAKGKKGKAGAETDPLQILKLRYAKGEITKKQFEEMRKDIES